MKNRILSLILIALAASIQFRCSGVSDTIKNAERLKFKLGSVDKFSLGGVKLKNINSISDLNLIDAGKILAAFTAGNLNASFDVNLIAKNPDTPGGSKESSSLIKALDWRLLIDDKDVIDGSIDKPITIPGVGQQVTIPIPVKVDFAELFGNGGYENLVNLALAIGGKSGNSSRLKLKIQPTIDTFLGGISYPGEITVVDKEFR